MKKQVVCEYCGKAFTEEYDCIMHEIEHLCLESKFKSNLIKALNKLDNEYEVKSKIKKCKLTIDYSEDENEWKLHYMFEVSRDVFDKNVEEIICVDENRKERNIPSSSDIYLMIMHQYFTNKNVKVYEGKFSSNGYSEDGKWTQRHSIGNYYIYEIFRDLGGKKVRIEIVE